MFPISPEKESALRARLEGLDIYDKDLQETFVRSQGSGGQKVNKTSTCVLLRHGPTGIEVKCQKSRSQGMNRYYARVILCEKIENSVKGEESKEAMRVAKLRRQKRKRSKRAKEKVLEDKKMQSEKKILRVKPSDWSSQ
ncbi:MAG: peptide chain release factor-like protein [Nitrospira sp.]|nr:peptide chain release factor-like protein [bacterium]MBL7049572.1 peptide chain release factor-like protein [Nitrospira sp.]